MSELKTKSRERSSSIHSDLISETDSHNDKYKKMAKKLAKEKSGLKDKLRKLLDEVDFKNKEHQTEMEKTQEYFQEQIDDLIKEKERACDEVEKMRTNIIEEKEKIRLQFEQKMNKYKETLEKRFGSKDSPTVKRLENTIQILEEKLNKQSEDNEQNEEKFKQIISDLQEQLIKAKEHIENDRKELQMLIKTYNDEKQIQQIRFKKEKDEEVKNILAEKNMLVTSLQKIKTDLEKNAKEADDERDIQLQNASREIKAVKNDYENKFTEVSANFKKCMEETKTEYESKLFLQEKQKKIDIENIHKEYDKKIEGLKYDHENVFHSVLLQSKKEKEEIRAEHTKENEIFKKEINQFKFDIETLKNALSDYQKREEEIKQEVQNKQKEIENIKLKNDKINGELEDTNQKLREQITSLKENIKKIHENSQNINAQFINNLNKQKELAEKEIFSRDNAIAGLEKHIKNIGNEYVDKINSLEKKIRTINQEHVELSEKYEKCKKDIEQKNNQINTEDSKLKKLQTLTQQIQAKYISLEFETQKKDTIIKDLRNDLDNSNKNLQLYQTDLAKTKTQLTEEHRQKILELQVEKEKQTLEFKQLFGKADIVVQNLNKEKENLSLTISRLSGENEKLKQTINSYMKNETEHEIRTQQLSKLQQEHITLKNDYNTIFETFTKEKAIKEGELAKLKQQIETKESNFAAVNLQLENTQKNTKQIVDKISAEHKKDREELLLLKGKISMMQDKSSEVDQLKVVLAELQETTKNDSKKAEEKYLQEVEKYKKKINDLDVIILQHQQKVETIKLEFLKHMNEAKKLPPEDQSRLEKAEKENAELKIHLAASEKKLQQLQFDIAEKNAVLQTKMQTLNEREVELRKNEAQLKNAPMKLLDPSLKKDRDTALAHVRQMKLEIAKVKDESIQAVQKLQVAEEVIKEMEKEKHIIIKNQTDLKETFVNNLNQQQEKHEQELLQKNQRIKELEKILTEKLK